MSYSQYVNTLKAVMERMQIDFPSVLLDHWIDFYTSCSNGYIEPAIIFFDELAVRDKIGKLLKAKELKDYDEFKFFEEEIAKYDELIKGELLLNIYNPFTANVEWWQSCLPQKATVDFVNTIAKYYGENIAKDIQIIY